MNPYREAAPPPSRPVCPACGRPLDGDPDGPAPLTCAARCGVWFDTRLLVVPMDRLGEPDAIKPFASAIPPICPRCQASLERRVASGIPFAICRTHGAWVSLDSMVRFQSRVDRLAREIEAEERALVELAESFTTEEGRRAVARRILVLEARLAKLEKG